jgi:hypothetical protein
MKLYLPVLALALATGLPLAACAQQSNASDNGPSPEIRAQLQQARDNAKTAAFNDLTPANRVKVQGIIDQVNNGQLTDLKAATQQINAVLTPAEAKAVLAEADKLKQTMRSSMPRPEGSAPPNAADHPRGGPWGASANDAGRFLLQLGVSREKLRALRQQQAPQQQQ